MRTQFLLATAGVFAAFALSPPGVAQAPSQSAATAKASSAISAADRKFVETAGEAGLAEVEMAKAAQQRGAGMDVKSFADRMVADHGKTNEELKSIATTKGIPVPDKLSAKDSRELAKLQKLDAGKFDKEYVSSQVAAHKDAVKLFKKESASGKDAELKMFATSTLPTLQEHLTTITTMAKNEH